MTGQGSNFKLLALVWMVPGPCVAALPPEDVLVFRLFPTLNLDKFLQLVTRLPLRLCFIHPRFTVNSWNHMYKIKLKLYNNLLNAVWAAGGDGYGHCGAG